MHKRSLPSFLILLVAMLGGALAAQEPQHKKKEPPEMRFVNPEKYERATVADAEGLLQWEEWKEVPCQVCKGKKVTTCLTCYRLIESEGCPECQGKGDAPCRACGGLGHYPDPLERALCPQCMGAGCIPCNTCAGGGKIKEQGGGDRWGNCPSCRGSGGWVCAACEGKRLVETPALKPSAKDASVQQLQKALAVVDGTLTAVLAYEIQGNQNRKWVKEFNATIPSAAQSLLPPLKKVPKALEEIMRKLGGGSMYIGHEESEAHLVQLFQGNVKYYLQFEKRLLELSLARAENNAKVLAEKKGK